MLLRFSKMHCLGDDLMVVELLGQYATIQPQQVQRWASRTRGVGFKRLVLIEVPDKPDVDFVSRVFSAEGEELETTFVDLCCLSRLVWDKRLTARRELSISSRGGLKRTTLYDNGRIGVEYPLQSLAGMELVFGWESHLEVHGPAGSLSVSVQGQQQQKNHLCIELVKDELDLALDFARQQAELRGVAARLYEGQIRI